MTTVFVESSAASQPGAREQLGHLFEAGFELVLLASPDDPSAGAVRWAERRDRLPDPLASRSWLLTADPVACGDRRPDLRTILIGAGGPPLRPTRCDGIARDVHEAVLRVLAEDAMG